MNRIRCRISHVFVLCRPAKFYFSMLPHIHAGARPRHHGLALGPTITLIRDDIVCMDSDHRWDICLRTNRRIPWSIAYECR